MSDRRDSEEAPLIDEVREALDGQPLDLLGLAGMVIEATAGDNGPAGLDDLITAFIGTPLPETTALLAAFGELAPDGLQRSRCRDAVAARHEQALPSWLAHLARSTVDRAVLMTDVFGDGEEVLLGVGLADGPQLTCAVNIDHLSRSSVKDAFFVPESIETVLTIAQAGNDDPDTDFVELDLADAGATLQIAIDPQLPVHLTDTWPTCRPLVQWLVRLMPDGGTAQVPHRDGQQSAEVLDRFFVSLVGMRFDDAGHRRLLQRSVDAGTGDPLRWSAVRVQRLLDDMPDDLLDDGDLGTEIPVRVQATLPELLRAYVPFAHARAGIRAELTAASLDAIDERAEDYRAAVLDRD